MIKSKRSTILLTLAALALAFISAALLFMVAPKRAAKADGEVQTVISEYPDPTGWGVKDLEVGDTIAGTYIIMSYSTAGTLNFNFNVDNDRFYGLMLSQDKWKLCFTNDFTNTYVEEITMSEGVVAKLITIAGGNDLYFYIPQMITGMYAEVDITGATLNADSYLPGTVKLVSPLIVSEPEQPEDPGTEPEQPGENSGTEGH